MATYDIKVKVKTTDGNTVTRTIVSKSPAVNAEADYGRLLSKYQKLTTDKIVTDTGYAEVTVVENRDINVESASVTLPSGQDYLGSDDSLSIKFNVSGEDETRTVTISNSATYDTVEGASYGINQYMNDVRAFASAVQSATSNQLTPSTATLKRVTSDKFSANEDG